MNVENHRVFLCSGLKNGQKVLFSNSEKMAAAINPLTGGKAYTFAVGFSLLLFYVFALQCMSTIAIVYKETKHWKWPLIQFIYMGALAYLSSFIAYTIFK